MALRAVRVGARIRQPDGAGHEGSTVGLADGSAAVVGNRGGQAQRLIANGRPSLVCATAITRPTTLATPARRRPTTGPRQGHGACPASFRAPSEAAKAWLSPTKIRRTNS